MQRHAWNVYLATPLCSRTGRGCFPLMSKSYTSERFTTLVSQLLSRRHRTHTHSHPDPLHLQPRRFPWDTWSSPHENGRNCVCERTLASSTPSPSIDNNRVWQANVYKLSGVHMQAWFFSSVVNKWNPGPKGSSRWGSELALHGN